MSGVHLFPFDQTRADQIAPAEAARLVEAFRLPDEPIWLQTFADGPDELYACEEWTDARGQKRTTQKYQLARESGVRSPARRTTAGGSFTLEQIAVGRYLHENQARVGVFWTVNVLKPDAQRRTADAVARVAAVFVDLDGAPLPAEGFHLRPTAVVESSPGRFHAYWAVHDLPLEDFTATQKHLAALYGGDPSVSDLPRVMRLPGYWHGKREPGFVTHILELDPDAQYSRADLLAAFSGLAAALSVAETERERLVQDTQQRRAEADQMRAELEGGKATDQAQAQRKWAQVALLGGLADLLGAVEGTRNSTLNAVAYRLGRIVAAGLLDEAEVRTALGEVAERVGLGQHETAQTLGSGLESGKLDPVDPSKIGALAGARGAAARLIGGEKEEPWPPRVPLPPRLPEAPTLPAEMVPERLRSWLVDIAELSCIPLEYVAAPALAGLSGLIGRSVSLKPEGFTDWTVTPNIWAAIVGSPGQMKSLAVKEALAPLTRLEAQAADAFRLAQQEAEIEGELLKDERARLKSKKGAGLTREALQDLKQREEENTVTARRYVLQNVTVEKLGELLRENPRGLTVVRDELAPWLHDQAREEQAEALGFFLAAWNGDGGYTFDRIGRGTVRIPQVCVSVVGGIQPGPLGAFIASSRAGSKGDHGLLQRFQLFVYPDSLGTWSRPNRQRDHAAKNRAFDLYEALDGLYNPDRETQAVLTFDAEAQQIWNDWRDKLEGRLRGHEFEGAPGFESHLSKYRSLVPSLAAVFHLVQVAAPGMHADALGDITAETLELALNWAAFLEAHARKVYAYELGLSMIGAYALADKIKAGSVKDGDGTRDLRRKDWAELSGARFDTALEQLLALGWVRVEDVLTDGAPREVLRLHPELRKAQA